MKLLKSRLFVGLLAVAALALVFKNVLWPILHRPSSPKPRQTAASAPAPTAVAASRESAAKSTPSAGGSAALSRDAATLNQPTPASAVDLSVAQTNSARWTESPQRDPFQIRDQGTNRAGAFPSAMELLRLRAVWRQSGSALAVINNRVVSEGDTISRFRVETIGAEQVWVNGPNGREEVAFRYDDSQFADLEHRIVGGETNEISTAKGWFDLRGKIQQVISAGSYLVSPKLENDRPTLESEGQIIIVKNVPYDRAEGDPLPPIRCKYVGNDTFTDTSGAKRTKHAYDYGTPCDPPKAAVDRREFQKAFLLRKGDEARARRAKFDIEAAGKGSSSAQYTLGRRYLFGEGVPRNENEARGWLLKSAAQGNKDAQTALQTLDARK